MFPDSVSLPPDDRVFPAHMTTASTSAIKSPDSSNLPAQPPALQEHLAPATTEMSHSPGVGAGPTSNIDTGTVLRGPNIQNVLPTQPAVTSGTSEESPASVITDKQATQEEFPAYQQVTNQQANTQASPAIAIATQQVTVTKQASTQSKKSKPPKMSTTKP
ncbi:hypothetical protein PQX77_021189 [Marasmius sp. AFHP31]|nr:hypothetical protein PQX77_021189 [Marasmius sp. AFHP31]